MKTYEAKVECSNCDFRGTIHVPKGTTKREHLKTCECPGCECMTLNEQSSSITLPNVRWDKNRDYLPWTNPDPYRDIQHNKIHYHNGIPCSKDPCIWA